MGLYGTGITDVPSEEGRTFLNRLMGLSNDDEPDPDDDPPEAALRPAVLAA